MLTRYLKWVFSEPAKYLGWIFCHNLDVLQGSEQSLFTPGQKLMIYG